jgi:hypothetical protein
MGLGLVDTGMVLTEVMVCPFLIYVLCAIYSSLLFLKALHIVNIIVMCFLGFEKEMFKRQNERRATEQEAYLWSVSDM